MTGGPVKVLWVKSGGFLPLDTGGKIRSYSLLRELARRHDLSVFTFYPQHEDDQHSDLNAFCREVICLPMALPVRASFTDMLAYARNVVRPVPYSMVKYCRPEVAARLRELLGSRSYDAIICDFLLTAAVIPWDLPTPKILFTHNVEAVIWERHWRVSRNPFFKLISWREFRTMERVERLYLQKADRVLTVSDSDRDFFSRMVAPHRITTIPTGVDVEYFHVAPPDHEQPDTLVFTGSMDWLPNEDAMFHFAEEIFPLVQGRVPDVKMRVVGRRPSPRVQALAASNSGIEVTGTVPDIRPYLGSAAVYVVPLRIGGGTRIKIFEAMAMGKAVVSTSIGAEGLPVTHGENIILADNPQDFAAGILRLLASKDERQRIGMAARQLVETQYSWSAVTDVLDRALLQAVRKHSLSSSEPELLSASH
jgi:sugar transferase (PEP-CTERM/EpsH1 system associated)